MKTRTIISYLPGKTKKPGLKKRKTAFWGGLFKVGKFILLLALIVVYLVYTNQSSTLGYSLRKSLRDVEKTQEQLDVLQLQVSKKEQELWAQVERKPSKKVIRKIIIP